MFPNRVSLLRVIFTFCVRNAAVSESCGFDSVLPTVSSDMKVLWMILAALIPLAMSTLQPKAPNFQYFERPRYRYPYYDEHGRGKLLYGYGGDKLYEYTKYSALEGVH